MIRNGSSGSFNPFAKPSRNDRCLRSGIKVRWTQKNDVLGRLSQASRRRCPIAPWNGYTSTNKTGFKRNKVFAETVPNTLPRAAAKMTMNPIRRDAPCPCGSGRRFEHCHGKEFGPPPVPEEIAKSVRFVCFETHLEDFRLATNGGTAFVVRYKGTPFAITCRHVMNGFNIDELVITDARFGRKVAGVRGMYYPGNLKGGRRRLRSK